MSLRSIYNTVVFLATAIPAIIACIPVYTQAQQRIVNDIEHRAGISEKDRAAINNLLKRSSIIKTNIDSAIALAGEAKQRSMALGYPDGVAEALLKMASYCINQGKGLQARRLLDEAWPYCRYALFGQKRLIILWYTTKGKLYKMQSEHDSAALHFIKGLELAEQKKDTHLLITLNIELASTWLANQQLHNVLPYLKQAEKLATQWDRGKGYHLDLYMYYAITYSRLQDSANAYLYAQKALAEARSRADRTVESKALVLLGIHAFQLDSLQQAIDLFQQALSVSDSNHLKTTTDANLLRTRMDAYYGLSDAWFRLKDFNRSLQYGIAALNSFDSSAAKSHARAGLYWHLAKVYNALHENDKAYEFQLQYSTLSDELNNTARNTALDKIEAKYREAQKEKELAVKQAQLLQQQSVVRNQYVWIGIVCTGIVILGGMLLSLYLNSKKKLYIIHQQKEINELKSMINGEEKERNRIAKELHDGVGGLLSAATLNLNNMKEENITVQHNRSYNKAVELVREISNEVRKTAHNLMPDVILRNDLDEAVKLYCTYIKQHTNLDITVQANAGSHHFEQQFKLSVYRIVQELIQNILKHARATTAFVQLQTSNDLLTITIEDNGRGFDIHQDHEGMGLRSIRERVAAYKGDILIESAPETGTSTNIEFDLKATGMGI